MRISDWSSDVCSSDLEGGRREARADHDADRIIGSQPRRQDDRQNDENDGAEAEEPERVGQQQAKGDLEGAGQPRLGDGCGLGRRHHSFSLMRGSSAALPRSAKDRRSVGRGKSEEESGARGGRRVIKKKKNK